eukprot:6197304-Pleurochrysis_carterae.AAC.3
MSRRTEHGSRLIRHLFLLRCGVVERVLGEGSKASEAEKRRMMSLLSTVAQDLTRLETAEVPPLGVEGCATPHGEVRTCACTRTDSRTRSHTHSRAGTRTHALDTRRLTHGHKGLGMLVYARPAECANPRVAHHRSLIVALWRARAGARHERRLLVAAVREADSGGAAAVGARGARGRAACQRRRLHLLVCCPRAPWRWPVEALPSNALIVKHEECR